MQVRKLVMPALSALGGANGVSKTLLSSPVRGFICMRRYLRVVIFLVRQVDGIPGTADDLEKRQSLFGLNSVRRSFFGESSVGRRCLYTRSVLT